MPEPTIESTRLLLQTIARTVDSALNGTGPRTVGFMLYVFPIGDAVKMNCITNCGTPDVVAMLREHLAILEGRMQDGPTEAQ